jgi:hypothetical protein
MPHVEQAFRGCFWLSGCLFALCLAATAAGFLGLGVLVAWLAGWV